MRTRLAELWNGNLSPVECCGKGDPEIENLIELIERNKEDLFGTLDNTQKKILGNYQMCIEEYENLMQEQAFCDGFSLGCQLLTEAFTAKMPM